jgi:hypothetical protein
MVKNTKSKAVYYVESRRKPLIASYLEEALIVVTHFPSLVKGPGALAIQTSKVLLNILYISFKVLPYQLAKLVDDIWVARNIWSHRGSACFCIDTARQADTQNRCQRSCRGAQPEVSVTPYLLE